ncbi:MAG: hypothetical protein ABW202_07845, partial [Duganella sp.]
EVKTARVRFVSYKESYELAKKVQLATSGRVAMGILLVPAKPGVRVDDVQLWLDGEKTSIPVSVHHGLFVIPINDEIAAGNGSYSINKQKGDVTARVAVLPAIAQNAWTIAKVRQSLADAVNAVDKFTPWYQKPFAMKIRAVAVCSNQAGMPLKLFNGNELVAELTTSEKSTDDSGQQVFCQSFAKDTQYDDAVRLDIPAEAQVLFL